MQKFINCSGQAKLVVEPGKHRSQYSRLMTNVDATKKRRLTQNIIHVKRKFGYAEAEKVINHKLLDLAYMTEGDMFGKLIALLENENRKIHVCCDLDLHTRLNNS